MPPLGDLAKMKDMGEHDKGTFHRLVRIPVWNAVTHHPMSGGGAMRPKSE